MWLLIKQRTLLRRAGQLCRSKGQHMQCTIHAALRKTVQRVRRRSANQSSPNSPRGMCTRRSVT
jgi:hypothetical protein